MGSVVQNSQGSSLVKRWWARLLFGVLLISLLAVGISALAIRSQLGLRTIVIPYLSSRMGGDLTINSPKLSWKGVLTGQNVQVKVADASGVVWLVAHIPEVSMDLLRDVPAIHATQCDVDVLRWPELEKRSRTKTVTTTKVPNLALRLDQLNVAFPELMAVGGVPRLSLEKFLFDGNDGALLVKTNGVTDFKTCHPSWQWLNRTNVLFSVGANATPAGLRWKGRIALSNSFDTAPLPELESASVECEFDVSDAGAGVIALRLRGKEFELLNLDAEVEPGALKRRITIDMGGPALELPTGLRETTLKVRKWNSRCRMNWDFDTASFDGLGSFEFPGMTVHLPNQGKKLPPLTLRGKWSLNRSKDGEYTWNGGADVKKGEASLLHLGVSSRGERPVYLDLPNHSLAELRPYLKPFGITLPNGRVGGRLSLTSNQTGGYDGRASLNVSKLIVDPDDGDAMNFIMDVRGSINPKESITLKTVSLKGNLVGGKDKEKNGTFVLKMHQASTIFFDSRNRQDFPGKATFGLDMLIRDPKRVPTGSIQIRGRAGIHLVEAPRCWFEVLGNFRGRPFLQSAVDVFMNKDWSLKRLELSNFSVQNYTTSHAALLGNLFDGQLKDLSANAVIKQGAKDSDGTFNFSGNARCTGLKAIHVPSGPGLSKDLKVSGRLDLNTHQLVVSRLFASGRIPASDRHPLEARYVLYSKGKMSVRWSPRLYFRTGQLELSGALPSSYLPNFSSTNTSVPIKFRALLSAESDEQGRHATALSFSSIFDGRTIAEVDLTGGFTGTGKIRSIKLTRGALSIPNDLATVMGSWCPEVDRMTCVGGYANGAFRFSGGSRRIQRLALLPQDTIADSVFYLSGKHASDVTQIDEANFNLNCGISNKPQYLVVKSTLERPGRINWKPDAATTFSLPMRIDLSSSPQMTAGVPTLENVRNPLHATCDLTVNFDGKTIRSDAAVIATVGGHKVAEFKGSIVNGKFLQPKTFQIHELRVWNRSGVNLADALDNSCAWAELHMGGAYDFTHRQTSGFLTLNEFTHPHTGIMPWNLTVKGAGTHKRDKRFEFSRITLNGISKMASGPKAIVVAEAKGSLVISLKRTFGIDVNRFLGTLSLNGAFPESWVNTACEDGPNSSHESLEVKALADVSPGRMVLKINGDVAGKSVIAVNGHLGIRNGTPITGTIDGRSSWHPVLKPLTRLFGIEGYGTANAGFQVVVDKGTPRFTGDWNVRGMTLFSTKDARDQMTLDGDLRGTFARKDHPLSIQSFHQKMTVGTPALESEVRLVSPVVMKRGQTALFGVALAFPESFALRWMGRPTVADDVTLTADGTVSVIQGDSLATNVVGVLRRNAKTIADLEGVAFWRANGRLESAAIKRLNLANVDGLDRFHSIFAKVAWENLAFDGLVAPDGNGYLASGKLSLTKWRPMQMKAPCAFDSHAEIRATANPQLVFSIQELAMTNDVLDLRTHARIGRVTADLVGTGVFTPMADKPVGRGRIRLSGTLKSLPGVDLEMRPCTIGGTVEALGGKTRFVVGADLRVQDGAGDILAAKGSVTSGWDLVLQSIKIDGVTLDHRPWISALTPTVKVPWRKLTYSGKLLKGKRPNELVGPVEIGCLGVELDPWMHTDLTIKTILGISQNGVTSLTNTTVNATGHDRKKRQPMFDCLFTQKTDTVQCDGKTLETVNAGKWTFEGAMKPAMLALIAGHGERPVTNDLPFRGKFNYDGTSGKGDALLFYRNDELLQIQPEFDRDQRFFGVKVRAQKIPDSLAAAWANPTLVPLFKSADLTLTIRGEEDRKWSVYTAFKSEGIRDREGVLEQGDVGVDAQFTVEERDGGMSSVGSFPLNATWNGTSIMTSDMDVSCRGLTRGNVRLLNLKVPLTTLFSALNRNALSPLVTCSGGDLSGNLSLGVNTDGWVSNVIVKIDSAKFEERIGDKTKTFDFDWDLVVNGTGKSAGERTVAITANGPGWKNEATLRLGWSRGQDLPTMITLKGDDFDLSSFHRIFRRNARFKIENGNNLDLSAYIPSLDRLRTFKANYSVELNDLTIGPLQFDDVDVRFMANAGRCDLLAGNMELNGGTIKSSGFLDAKGGLSNVMIDVKGEFPIQPILAFAFDGENPSDVNGHLDLELRATGSGKTMQSLVKQTSGKGSLTIKDLEFHKIPGLEQPARDMMIESFERLEFDHVTADLVINEMTLGTRNLVFSRDELKMGLVVSIGLDGKLEVRDATLGFSKKHKAKLIQDRLVKSIGSGWDSLSVERDGYLTYKLPFIFIRNASGWTAEAVDATLAKPFNDSSVGRWLSSLFKKRKRRPTSP